MQLFIIYGLIFKLLRLIVIRYFSDVDYVLQLNVIDIYLVYFQEDVLTARTFTNFKMRISAEDVKKLEERVRAHPDNLDYLDWAAFAFYSNGLFAKAIAGYKRLIASRTDNPSYHYYLANSLYRNGDINSAKREWNTVIKIDKRGQFTKRSKRKLHQLENPEN